MSALLMKLKGLVRRHVLGRKPVGSVQERCATLRLGSEYGGWVIHPEGVDSSSIVYSFGVGEDVSFDVALIKRFGVTVHAFDPTPRSMEWVKQERAAGRIPESFVATGVGLAAADGEVEFFAPKDPAHVSHTMLKDGEGQRESIRVPVRSLATLMAERGHSSIDILKMDIEGAEYEVIEELARRRLPIKQLLIEFHYPTIPDGRRRTEQAIATLNSLGFKLFHIAESGLEYSFRAG